jgi:alkanesulfonate monooxygenase SsuD/methylene tetrahydromethanopterin reductase-like flavin-dependent oxidoreductase (luciferase family)
MVRWRDMMAVMTTLGAVFLPQLPPERLRSVAAAAEDAGLEQLWLWEDCFRESGIASAAAALACTERLTVAVGVLPVPLRNVALTAMEIANLERMFPERLLPGVGHGVQSWMAQVGGRVESPLTLLREQVTALRALLHGESVTTDGRYVHLAEVKLDWPPTSAPPLLIAATGPKTLRLSGELADGTVLSGGTTPEDVRSARALIDEGRESGGRTDEHQVVVYVLAGTGPGAQSRIEAELAGGDLDPSADIAVSGDAAAVAEGAQRWVDCGADVVVLQPTADDPDPEGFMRFVAQEVRPLLP